MMSTVEFETVPLEPTSTQEPCLLDTSPRLLDLSPPRPGNSSRLLDTAANICSTPAPAKAVVLETPVNSPRAIFGDPEEYTRPPPARDEEEAAEVFRVQLTPEVSS